MHPAVGRAVLLAYTKCYISIFISIWDMKHERGGGPTDLGIQLGLLRQRPIQFTASQLISKQYIRLSKTYEANKHFIPFLCSDSLPILRNRHRLPINRHHVSENAQRVGQACTFENIFGQCLICFSCSLLCKALDLGPVRFVLLKKVKVDKLSELQHVRAYQDPEILGHELTAVAVFATKALAVPTKISATSLTLLPEPSSFRAKFIP